MRRIIRHSRNPVESLPDAPTASSPPAPSLPAAAPSANRRWPWLVVVGLALAVIVYAGLHFLPQWRADAGNGVDLSGAALDRRLLEVEQALGGLRRGQQGVDQRLTDTRARTDLLRDEVLGVGQRAAIIEDNLRELANANRDSRDLLRLDEAELLLGLAQTRLSVAGDIAGAINATVLAEGALSALTDPRWVSLRQTIADELATLRRLPADPRTQARRELDALEAALPSLAAITPAQVRPGPPPTGLQRLLDALIQVRATGEQDLLAPSARASGEAALALELALARTALEQRDDVRFRASLSRVGQWLRRLYLASPQLTAQLKQIETLAAPSLIPDWPALGTTLAQLREQRRAYRVEAP